MSRQTAMHECPHPDCSTLVPYGMFACRAHWFSLPRPIRLAIQSAWHRITCGVASGLDAHDKATAEALAYWTGQP